MKKLPIAYGKEAAKNSVKCHAIIVICVPYMKLKLRTIKQY